MLLNKADENATLPYRSSQQVGLLSDFLDHLLSWGSSSKMLRVFFANFLLLFCTLTSIVSCSNLQGLYDLVERRLPQHCGSFQFTLTQSSNYSNASTVYDSYTIANGQNGSISIRGQSLSAISYGYVMLEAKPEINANY